MQPEPVSSLPKRETRPGIGLASVVEATLRDQIDALATELQRCDASARAEPPAAPDTPCDAVKERLDQKRKELQACLDGAAELKERLAVLKSIPPPGPQELRVRVLLMHGSIYDFTRLGRADHRERLDHALRQAAQILATQAEISVIFGQPKVVPRGANATWELTPDELWQLGERYASEGTPALLFLDRLLLPDRASPDEASPDEALPHSWGRPERSIAAVGENEWLGGGEGLITAHNLLHLLGLDDNKHSQHLMSHQELGLELRAGQVEQLRARAAERAARWVEEHATACRRGEEALSQAQHTVVLLEGQGDQLWQRYQTCMEKSQETPARPDLAQQVEGLAQQIARAERELAEAKELLAEIQSRLSELDGRE